MKLKIRKEYGDAFINLLRQLCLTTTKKVKPIAFAVGTNSNVLEIGNTVEEDMTEFVSNVSHCTFVTQSQKELLEWSGICEHELKADQIKSNDVESILSFNTLLHSLAPIKVQIYFRNSDGSHSDIENQSFLASHDIDTSRLVVIPSRHCVVSAFTFKYEDLDENYRLYDVNVVCEQGYAYESFLEDKIKLISTIAQDLI